MDTFLKSKSLLIILTAIVTVLLTLLFSNFFTNSFGEEFPREITRCGSTLPITCETYRCEKGYIVPLPEDGPPPIPGGGTRNRTCSDGSAATVVPEN
jgi:hypothetical protein